MIEFKIRTEKIKKLKNIIEFLNQKSEELQFELDDKEESLYQNNEKIIKHFILNTYSNSENINIHYICRYYPYIEIHISCTRRCSYCTKGIMNCKFKRKLVKELQCICKEDIDLIVIAINNFYFYFKDAL